MIICNFANADMVGHTGDFRAAVKAVEFLDKKIKEIVETCVNQNVPLLVTADHGNIELMVDPKTGRPHTEHTKNPVPFIIVSDQKDIKLTEDGKLGNVAPSILKLISLEQENTFLKSLF